MPNNTKSSSDLDQQEQIQQSIKLGITPEGIGECPACVKIGLIKCRCKKGGGGSSGGGSDDSEKKKENDPYRELNKLAEKSQLEVSDSPKIPEMRLTPETGGKRLSLEDEKEIERIFGKLEHIFQMLINEFKDHMSPQLLKKCYIHLDKKNHYAIINLPNAELHDAFIQLIINHKLLPSAQLDKMQELTKNHERKHNFDPFPIKLKPKKDK